MTVDNEIKFWYRFRFPGLEAAQALDFLDQAKSTDHWRRNVLLIALSHVF